HENAEWALSRVEEMARLRRISSPDVERWIDSILAEEGWGRQGRQLRRLHGEQVWHLAFPEGYLDGGPHPTWTELTDLTPPTTFGGAGEGTCSFCAGQLHHLLTLDPVPGGIGVTTLPRLTLAVCLSCLG